MGMREKLIELLQTSPMDIVGNHPIGSLADWLIANGVTIPVRCKDCTEYNGHRYCRYTEIVVLDNDFCSYGERKDNDST